MNISEILTNLASYCQDHMYVSIDDVAIMIVPSSAASELTSLPDVLTLPAGSVYCATVILNDKPYHVCAMRKCE